VTAVKEKRTHWNFKEEASISEAATGRISVKFDFGTYMKICREDPNFVKTVENIGILHEDTRKLYCCWRY
jgi:hypothetical protein